MPSRFAPAPPPFTAAALVFLLALPARLSGAADPDFSALAPERAIASFRVECVYDNAAGAAMGARFRHAPSGFVLDCLRIQSVPQAFMWVNTTPPSDQGEPHTLEHLLLGKGTRGRYVASLEEMSLGESSAFTLQLRTCYHFHTAAGVETFYTLLEAKLEAMLHPTFSDEEIRREVCNMGVATDPATGTLRLEEKGTVYSERVSTFERPWSPLSRELDVLLYGTGHPMALDAGGLPAAIRTMTPADIRAFHGETHHLANMGMIVTIPDDVALADCLGRMSDMLERLEPDARPGLDPATAAERLPAPRPAPPGSTRIVEFPHQNGSEPGLLVLGWAPLLDLDVEETIVLELLVQNLAGGETSDLYRLLIDSQTRVMDLGASTVFGWTTDQPGLPFYVGLSNVRPEKMTAATIDSVRALVLAELGRVAAFADGSPALSAYNERAMNRLIERRRLLRKFLDSPPGFGTRHLGAAWMDHLTLLQRAGGFRRPLALNTQLGAVEELIASKRNLWREAIERWQLITRAPTTVAARPNPTLIAESEAARSERITAFTADLARTYGVSDHEEAIQRFKAEHDARTAEIDSAAATIELPPFLRDPPLTLDEQLRYKVGTFPGDRGGELVTSTFDNMSGATVGLAFHLDVVPESLLVYVPALPTLLTDVGVIRDGKRLTYDAMKEAVRREILELTAYFSSNLLTDRVELAVRASGTDADEAERAVAWIAAALFAPDWRAENLPRLRDAVDQALAAVRDRMREPEEMWTQIPANAYRKQDDPLILHAGCFLTQEHALHRLRWRLRDPGSAADQRAADRFLDDLAAYGAEADRPALAAVATALVEGESAADVARAEGRALVDAAAALPASARETIRAAATDLRQSLASLPDETLAADWRYLCAQMAADLGVPPAEALAELEHVRQFLVHADNVRGLVIASAATGEAMERGLGALASRLDTEPSVRQTYPEVERIVLRAGDRHPELAAAGRVEFARPGHVGLVNENTRSGVVINSAKCASYFDTDPEVLLRFLAAKLYGGGGAHSLFMKTWAAGLAYSNGVRSGEERGRIIYYAERCPDLAQTVRFVVNEIENAPADTALAEYALAQAFSTNRGSGRYEARGEAMAADLADGVTPEVVRRFRSAVLALRNRPDLYSELAARMELVYGEVLPGCGPAALPPAGSRASSFVIGPEKQIKSYERYLNEVAGEGIRLYRLYPRDFWITLPRTGSAPAKTRI